MNKKITNQKGFAPLLLLLIIAVIGIFVIAQYSKQKINLLPKATEQTPAFGKAIKFDNSNQSSLYNNAYLIVNPPTVSFTSSPFTVETWINLKKSSAGNFIRSYYPLSYVKSPTIYDPGYIFSFFLEINEQSGQYRPHFYQLTDNTNNTGSIFEAKPTDINFWLQPDKWNHIAITSYWSSNICYISIFVDGNKIGGGQRSQSNCKASISEPQGLLLGRNPYSSQMLVFDGIIDELRISKTVRYTSNFTPPTAPFNIDGETIALWHFDGNTDDSTGNNQSAIKSGVTPENITFIDSDIVPLPTLTPTPTPIPTQIPTPTPTSTPIPTPSPTSTPMPTPTPTTVPSILYRGHYHNGSSNVSQTTPLQLYHVTAANTGSTGYADITLPFSCKDVATTNVHALPYSGSPFYNYSPSGGPNNRAVGYATATNKIRLYVLDKTGAPQTNQWVSAQVMCRGGDGQPGTITYKGNYHDGTFLFEPSVPLQTYHISAAQTDTYGRAEVKLPFSCNNGSLINVIAAPYSNSPLSNSQRALGRVAWGANTTNIVWIDVLDSNGKGVAQTWVSGDIFCKGGTHPVSTIAYKGHYHSGSTNFEPASQVQLYHITAANTGSTGYAEVTLPFSCKDTYSTNVLETVYSGSPYYDAKWSPTNRAQGYAVAPDKVRIYVLDQNNTPQNNQWVSADVMCRK